jgi:hypothetical protein
MKAALAALLFAATSVLADSFCVHYSVRGSGRDVTGQAQSSAEARRTVMEMFPWLGGDRLGGLDLMSR